MKKLMTALLSLLLVAALSAGYAVSAAALEHKYIIGGVTVTENEAGDPVITVGAGAAHRIYPDTENGMEFDGFHFKLTDMVIPAGDGVPLAFCLEGSTSGGVFWYDSQEIPFFTIRRVNGKDSLHAFNTADPDAVWVGVDNPIELTDNLTDTLDFYVYKIGEFWYFEINGQVIPMNKAADGSAQDIENSLLKGHDFEEKVRLALGWGIPGQTYVLKEYGTKKAAVVSVNEQIAALPETVTLADKAAVLACKGAYEALTETQRAVVVGYDKVTAALARIEELERAASEDDALVAALMEDIDAIPAKVTAADKDSVLALKARYEALNEELQARITNYSKVTEALAAIEQAEKDDALVAALMADIEAIPAKVTAADKDSVLALKARYEALNGELQARITNYSKVTEALAAIEKIEKAEEKPETPPEAGAALPVTAVLLSAAALAAVWMLKERQKVR